MMTIILEVFMDCGLTVSGKKTEALRMAVKEKWPTPPPPPPLEIKTTGVRYADKTDFQHLGSHVNEHADLTRL